MTTMIRFTYFTGVPGNYFDAATLCGSWDSAGRYSDQWSENAMESFLGPDNCPAFKAECALDAGDPLQTFRWGVRLRGGGGSVWGIMREVVDARLQDRVCSFRLSDPYVEVQEYFLNSSRRLGAQRYGKGIRFSVWAPNAGQVDVVVGNLWQQGTDPQRDSLVHPANIPALASSARATICGGFIGDAACEGNVKSWGPFDMKNRAGIWTTDPSDPELAEFERFDHLPYMFRVKKDDTSVVYKTDLYSRCQIGYGMEKPGGDYAGLTTNLDGKVSCSVVVDPDKVCKMFTEPVWPETEWVSPEVFFAEPSPAPEIGKLRIQDLVIYELHLGALGNARRPDQPGTLQDACAFLDYLQDLGVNAVELLPLAEFGGSSAGWGYATTHYHAIEYSGGGRDQYKWFVRECHSRGIAVILDVVFNHYNTDAGRAEWMYDTGAH
jgi:1,4-alpha-glucan branching enzyme